MFRNRSLVVDLNRNSSLHILLYALPLMLLGLLKYRSHYARIRACSRSANVVSAFSEFHYSGHARISA